MASPTLPATTSLPNTKTDPLYQTHGQQYTHTAPVTSLQPLSSLPESAQSLFKPPPLAEASEPYILTTPSTIFHAQGGGQPSDTGTITAGDTTFTVHQVRRLDPAILHMGTFGAGTPFAASTSSSSSSSPPAEAASLPQTATQAIDADKRILHSRIHTAGHILGLAAASLVRDGALPKDLVDGKASHYPGAAFVEFVGLIPGEKKAALQDRADELVKRDLPVHIHFWDEARARERCTGVLEGIKGDERGVRVVDVEGVGMLLEFLFLILSPFFFFFGEVAGLETRMLIIMTGSYPCGGTHVQSTKECGRIVVRNIKRQKGVTKVSYEVQDV